MGNLLSSRHQVYRKLRHKRSGGRRHICFNSTGLYPSTSSNIVRRSPRIPWAAFTRRFRSRLVLGGSAPRIIVANCSPGTCTFRAAIAALRSTSFEIGASGCRLSCDSLRHLSRHSGLFRTFYKSRNLFSFPGALLYGHIILISFSR